MKVVPAVMLSTLAIVGTAVGATAANFAVLADHGSLQGHTDIGGIALSAEDHLKKKPGHHSANDPHPTSTAAANNQPSGQRHQSSDNGVPAPWVTEDDTDGSDTSDRNGDDEQPSVAVPTTNKPEVTLTPLPTKTKKHHHSESAHPDDEETESPEQPDDDDD